MSKQHYDIVIVGGGLVGASLAVMLKDSGLRLLLVEAFAPGSDAQPSYDDRTVALSHGSQLILDRIGVWQHIADTVSPIRTIHISDKGHLGVTRLHHHEEGVDALGYVAENRSLGLALYHIMDEQQNLETLCPASVSSVDQRDDSVELEIEHNSEKLQVTAACLVAADGHSSSVCDMLNLGSSGKHYGQAAVVTNVTIGKQHEDVAYERFTDQGPIAFLPMTQQRCSVVWTLPDNEAQQVADLDDASFLDRLQQRFGYRLGVLKRVGRRSVYPLVLQQSAKFTKGRTVVVGNAAHTVHPVAGQGLNLALRDVSALVDCVREQADPGASEVLQAYQQSREQDAGRVYRFTDALITLFSNRSRVLGHARAAGLMAVDLMPSVRHSLARQSMGLAGRLSSLGRS